MNDYKKMQGIQGNNVKQRVRDILSTQCIKFAKQTRSPIGLISLPSTDWKFEKGSKDGVGLIELCKKNNIPISIIGVENSSNSSVVKAFEKNAPKGMTRTIRGDFDECALMGGKFNRWNIRNTVVSADYCGNPAEHFLNSKGKDCYHYSHIKTFRDVVKEARNPMMYTMTFSCHGRIKGGKAKMMKALSPNASNVSSAIRHKISQTLTTYGLADKATLTASITYKGASKHTMLTLAYAINFKPKFPVIKENWMPKKEKKAKKIKSGEKGKVGRPRIDRDEMRKEAIKILSQHGWNCKKIGYAIKMHPDSVKGIAAWQFHRDSWGKKDKVSAKKAA